MNSFDVIPSREIAEKQFEVSTYFLIIVQVKFGKLVPLKSKTNISLVHIYKPIHQKYDTRM
jgi:hypothetical protein